MAQPKITFGIIVLNGEPFVAHNLRSLYSFAHQIIVVEGACRAAASIATPDGHSQDGTLQALIRFKQNEDPLNKLVIVTASDEGYADGFWPEKDEMSKAYASRATGNVLWQIDSDEFYLPGDIQKVRDLFEKGIDTVSFPTLHFFGGLAYKLQGFHMICDRYEEYHRVFRWGPGYTYLTHRPPTVLNEQGVDLRRLNWINREKAAVLSLRMFHYCYLFPHQVFKKASYYSTDSAGKRNGGFIPGADRWAREVYIELSRPFRMFITEKSLCWLERFQGSHPLEVQRMMQAVADGKAGIELRPTNDLDRLLRNPAYAASCFLLRQCARLLNNPLGLFLRRYSKAIVRYSRDGSLGRRFLRALRGKRSQGQA